MIDKTFYALRVKPNGDLPEGWLCDKNGYVFLFPYPDFDGRSISTTWGGELSQYKVKPLLYNFTPGNWSALDVEVV